ncbi:MAG: 16S rRNA (cytosine(1402)-N(4))-methyltransferase RsmH [Candidatus Omnitrophica bacterium]|nr:16S rRNA (cytosine(1402)-N(4))-methyltransferase RsmH [Candidatus Omnitrophota bacterium]MDD5026885.1 16S rRNA (cytosine(1402)-N(4))-methyltransferase RsmH [Candidatus Omnitrophota bacterium]MDD5662183.1 16S rRNA (cytosine(1402)-N(4))-methyltransferase RsmH [Candidatus Omnitrophota bacterium]
MSNLKFHTPVMLGEVLDYLDLKPGKTIVDATLGTAGHAKAILERILPGGRLIGIDRDATSLAVSRQRLSEFGSACELVHGNFVEIDALLENLKVKKVDGVLFDLGISSFQLQDARRGFSFQNEGPLDMRMDQDSYVSAYDLVNNLNEEELSTLLWNFGEERWHNRIAHILVQEREREPIATTTQLADIAARSIPARYRHRFYRIHPATRTFQAVRIAVNRELEVLDTAVNKAIMLLEKKGRVCVVAFHSLEDRAIKFAFRKAQSEGLIDILTPKPLTPLALEVENNPASRSSKLRAAKRI